MRICSQWLLCCLLLSSLVIVRAADSLTVADLLVRGNEALYFARFDQAVDAYREVRTLARGQFSDMYLAALNGGADAHISNARYAPAWLWLAAAQRYIDSLNMSAHAGHARTLYLSGKCAAEMGDYAFAQEKLAAAVALYRRLYEGEAQVEWADCFVWQGACYRRMGDFEQAKLYAQQAVAMYQKVGPEFQPGIANALNNIGYAYASQRDCEAAAPYYAEALAMRRNLFGENHPDVAESLHNIADCLNRQRDRDRSLKLLYQSLAIKKRTLSPDHYALSYSYNIIGSIHHLKREYDYSLTYAQRAMEILQRNFGRYHPALVPSYNNLATRHGIAGEYDLAKGYIQKGLMSLAEDFRDTSFYANPAVASVRYVPYVFNLLYSKSMVAQRFYQQVSHDPRDLDLAFQTFVLAGEVIDRLRMGYEFRTARQDLTANAMLIYEGGISLALQLYAERKDPALLSQAFIWSEKSKSLSVLEALRETDAQQEGLLPDSLLEEQRRLQRAIASQEKRLYYFDAEQDVAAQQLAATCRDSMLFYKSALADWMEVVRQAYPAYYHLKYDVSVMDLPAVQQQLLGPKEALISWFTGQRGLFAFVIRQDSAQLIRLPKSEVYAENIFALRSSIYDYFLTPASTDSFYQVQAGQYARRSHALYQELIAPLLPAGLDRADCWIIVPDGVLGYLPFEVLLTDSVTTPTAFASHPYLIQEKQISYAYSATLLRENRRKPDRSISVEALSIAPDFPAGDRLFTDVESYRGANLGPLQFNLAEAERVRSIAGGKILQSGEATLENFRQLGSRYGILHLATHGKANDRQADFSFLAFTGADTFTHSGLLYAHDLYEMELPAEMVVLSACETGIGKLQKGEGIASLARGFFFAGARSLITTLWSVNDAQTAELMVSFYLHLDAGMPKDAALRRAQLDYLDSHDDFYSHPYFWSGYVAIGDMSPLHFRKPFWGYYLIAGSGLLLLLLAGLWYRHRAQKPVRT